jgi:hypothetical protein
MNDTPATLDDILAREQIRAVLARYCRGIDRVDRDLIASVYHADGYDDHGPTYKGPASGFVDVVVEVLQRFERTLHFLGTSIIELDGDVAHTETYCIAYHRLRDDSGEQVDSTAAVRYIDRFERREGTWLIAHRKVVFEWSRRDAVGPMPPPSPDFAVGRRDREDAVYRR